MKKRQGLSRTSKIKRHCRICKKELPKSKYFYHSACIEAKKIIFQDWNEVASVTITR